MQYLFEHMMRQNSSKIDMSQTGRSFSTILI